MKKMKKRNFFQIGEYSSGTLRAQDIAESFIYEARKVRLMRDERNTVRRMEALVNRYDDLDEDELGTLDYMVYEDIPQIIDAHCLPYTYYGSIEGDGACIGVWPDYESARFATEEDYILPYNLDVPSYRGLLLEVNERGNVTLWERKNSRDLVEVWSLV